MMLPALQTLLMVAMALTVAFATRRVTRASDELAAAVSRTEALSEAGGALQITLEAARTRRTRLGDSVSRTPDR